MKLTASKPKFWQFHQRTKKRLGQKKLILFRSIQTRMITAITLLILMVVTAIIWLWATNEMEFYRQQKIQQVESFAAAFGQTLQLELGDRNWANMRTKMNLIMQSNEDFVYVIVSDRRENHQIVSAAPADIAGQFMTDLVPVAVSKTAVRDGQDKFKTSLKADAIDEYGGFIDKYIGDAVMALFDENHTDSALKAAIAMQLALKKFNQKREQLGLRTIASGIGIHRGAYFSRYL